jgi:hypothetical protein
MFTLREEDTPLLAVRACPLRRRYPLRRRHGKEREVLYFKEEDKIPSHSPFGVFFGGQR